MLRIAISPASYFQRLCYEETTGRGLTTPSMEPAALSALADQNLKKSVA